MWKQVGLLVVMVFLTLGQSMESDPPDNINRSPADLLLINGIRTIFTEWQSTALIVWSDDEILKEPKRAMQFVLDRFSKFGDYQISEIILMIDRLRGGNLNGDDTYRDLLDDTIKMNVEAQREMDRVISVILKDAKSMLQYSESNRLRFIAEYFPSIHTVRGSLFSIPYSYERVGVPMDKVHRKIDVFEKSLDSNIPPWMREKLDLIYQSIGEKKRSENNRFRRSTPTGKEVFDMISEAAGPLREPSEPTDRTGRTETTTVPPVVNDKWFPLFFLLAFGLIIATILVR
eukprot:69817_1